MIVYFIFSKYSINVKKQYKYSLKACKSFNS